MKGAVVWGAESKNDPGVHTGREMGRVCTVRGVFCQLAFCPVLKERHPIRYSQG